MHAGFPPRFRPRWTAEPVDWEAHRTEWPLAAHSRFVTCKPHRWHVQEVGSGPTLLLLHGAGGSTQSWRHIAPRLAERAHVVALDLPGQGFTRSGSRQRHGLIPTAQDIAALCAMLFVIISSIFISKRNIG